MQDGQPLTTVGTLLAVRQGHLPLLVGVHQQRRTVCVLSARGAPERPLTASALEGQVAEATTGHWTPYRIEHLQVIDAPGRRRAAETWPVMPGEHGALQAFFSRAGLRAEDDRPAEPRLDDQLIVRSLPEVRGAGVRLSVEVNVSTLRLTAAGLAYDPGRLREAARCIHDEFFGLTRGRDVFGLSFAEMEGELPLALTRVRTLVEALLARHVA